VVGIAEVGTRFCFLVQVISSKFLSCCRVTFFLAQASAWVAICVFGVLFKVKHVVSGTMPLHYGGVWGGGGRRLSAVGGDA